MTSREIKQRRLKMYLEAEEKILQGQSYTIGDRQLSRADLYRVQQMIEKLSAELENKIYGRVNYLVPFDQ